MGKLLDAVQGKKEAVPTLQKQDDLILQKQGGSLYEAVKKIQQSSLTPQPQTISQNPFINIPASADWTKKQPMSIAPKDTSKIDAAVEAAKKAKENADFLNSIPGIVLQTIMGLPAAAKKILLEIPAQEGGGAVLQLTGQKEMQPQTPVEKFILGNEPVKPLGEQGKEILQGFGVSEETAEKLGLPVGVAMLALDAWPGGGKTGLAKTLAETKNVSAVESILKKAGVADDLVATYSEPIAKMSKEKDVLKALDSIENIQNSTTMPKAPSELTVPKKPQQPIKPELEPLAEEARKYKSAEEFVKARGTPIYRGGEINNEIAGLGNLGSGVYFTTDAQQALSISKTKNEKFIEAILPKGEYATRKDILTAEQISLLNKKLKLGLDKEELKSAENFIDFYEGVITPRLEGSKMTQSQLGKIMEEVTGKVGIIDDYYGAKQYLIFNPKRIMTKNQLTDFYNQVVKGTPLPSPTPSPAVSTPQPTTPAIAPVSAPKPPTPVREIKPIPPELEPLAKEARKYESAEEFARGQGEILYRASPNLPSAGEFKKGTYFADSADKARYYSESHLQSGQFPEDIKINQFVLPKNKIFREPSTGNIITTDVVPVRTKSQLIDFYNQAVKGIKKVKPEPLKASTATTRLAKPAEELGLGGTIEQPIKKKIDTEILPKSPEKISTSETPILPEQTVQARKETLIAQKLNQSLPKEYNKNIDLAIDKTAKQIGEPPSLVKRVVNSLNETKTKLLENVQNTEERVRQLVETKGIKISDESNPYLKMTLYPGRVGYKMETAKKEVESIIKEMNKERITRKDISNFLLYRHAPERNAALGEKAAGITTKEAELRMKEILASEKGAKIQQLADRMQKLNNQTLDMLRESGVISNELYSKLRVKYKNHVPLNRIFEDTEDIGQALSGKGFDVRSTGIKRAFGSEREVSDIMANIIYNYEQAVLRSEKNIVDQATLAFARQNKDILGGLLDVIKPRAIGKTFEGRILMERTNDPKILPLFENGKPIWIKINDPNLAIALRGVGREKLGGLLNAVANFTRLYAGLATRFNPEFALPNKIRDLQESAVYLSAQNKVGFKAAAKMAARDSASVKDVIDYIAGKQTPGANLYREMKELGGTTGGFGLSTRKQTEMNLESMEKLVNSKTKTIATNLLEYIDNWNTIFEDSTRLSVYKQALEQGLSKKQAAAMAKEASINFNRMGKGGPVINALWMFSNASIQGTTKMIRSLKNPKVLGAVTMAIGGSVAAVNEFNDRMDKNWRDKVTKWDRLNGLPIVLPSSDGNFRYFTIPVSWGIKPIKVMSDYAYDAVSGEIFNAQQMISDTITAIVDAYNPVGGSDLASAIMPTVGDLPLEILRNRKWSGAKIRPDFDPNAPADIQYFSSLEETKTGQVAISITEFLQQKTGLAVSPADIKYAFEQIVGGAGRFGSKTVNLISGMTSGKPLPLDEYPMLSRFYRQRLPEEIGAGTQEAATVKKILGEQSRSRFKIQQEAETVYKNIKENPDQAMKKKLLSDAIKENPDIVEKIIEIAKDEDKGLTYTDRLIKQLGVENGERANYILEKIKQMKTNEEKKQYIIDLKNKGLLTDAVVKSMIERLTM